MFHEQVGATPDQLARSRRAHFARRLLDDTDLSVTDIAFAAGFGSLRQFNRAMRETFRDTPNPDQALGSNIAGAVLGGLAESLSAVLGFQYLLLVAIGFYLLSVWPPRLRPFPA